MAICLASGSLVGIEGIPVRVEVDLLRKLPSVVIVGLPGSRFEKVRIGSVRHCNQLAPIPTTTGRGQSAPWRST